jgi:protein tyrosine phosphatase (PTP) superfamily phosphohydrolase (DUF442 family)
LNTKAIELSRDHKPDVPSERHRIQNAGHEVSRAPSGGQAARIDNSIAVARAIGIVQPDVLAHCRVT